MPSRTPKTAATHIERIYAKTGAPVEGIAYGDRAVCTRYANAMVELANEYRPLLTAKK